MQRRVNMGMQPSPCIAAITNCSCDRCDRALAQHENEAVTRPVDRRHDDRHQHLGPIITKIPLVALPPPRLQYPQIPRIPLIRVDFATFVPTEQEDQEEDGATNREEADPLNETIDLTGEDDEEPQEVVTRETNRPGMRRSSSFSGNYSGGELDDADDHKADPSYKARR